MKQGEPVSIAIIGGGAAGCFAAANMLSGSNTEIILFEKTGKLMQKVKVSGGGRCNTTHHLFDVPVLTTRYPRGKNLVRKTLYRFTPEDTVAWFSKRGVALKAEDDGRMFPVTDSSQTIIDCIYKEMMRRQAAIHYHKSLQAIEKSGTRFILYFADGTTHVSDKVLVTCGGFPKESQYDWLKAMGHTIKPPVPSLFTFNLPNHSITQLMGVSVPDAVVKIAGTKIAEQGPVLVTHWGLSGPAVLRTSAWGARELADRNYQFEAIINWLGETTEAGLRQIINDQRSYNGKSLLQGRNPVDLPRRLWDYLTAEAGGTSDMRWGETPAAVQNKLVQLLLRHPFHVSGKTTYKEEFVTCGGINLSEIDGNTMQSRVIPGLYFAGEIVDVDGITGGFNFQHAWSSGYIAAESMTNNNKISA